MPSGKFVIIKRLTDLQIGIFKYALGEGCRNTTSERHDELPVPTYFAVHNPHNPRVFVSPCYRVCCNSAASCSPIIVYRTSWSYSSTQGELFIRDIVSSPLNTSLNEQQQRAKAAIEILRQKFGHIFCIEISPNDVTHFSSFRGGGDIHIYHQLRGGAVIMAPDSIPASELDEGGDSAEEGKTRCAAIEDKLTSLQKLRA